MTPEEELARLNRVIRQYETVYRTTTDSDQRLRVEKQLKELKDYREKFLAVNVVDEVSTPEAGERPDDLAEFPVLRKLLARQTRLQPAQRLVPLWARGTVATPAQLEIYHLMLYLEWFRDEFLPFLTEKRLKLDFKYSLDRDAFYSRYQDVERKMADIREENSRLAAEEVSRDLDQEVRKRITKLKRQTEADAAKLFRGLLKFARQLGEDADGEGVKCLNGGERINFDPIEGRRVLEGRTVRIGLEELAQLASEVGAFLNIPDIEGQEN